MAKFIPIFFQRLPQTPYESSARPPLVAAGGPVRNPPLLDTELRPWVIATLTYHTTYFHVAYGTSRQYASYSIPTVQTSTTN